MAIFEATYEREDGSMYEKEIHIDESACDTREAFWNAALKEARAEEEKEGVQLFNLEWTV